MLHGCRALVSISTTQNILIISKSHLHDSYPPSTFSINNSNLQHDLTSSASSSLVDYTLAILDNMTETEQMGMPRCNGSIGGGSTGRASAGAYRGSAGGDSTISMDSTLTPISPRQGSSGRGSAGSIEEISPTPTVNRQPSNRLSVESVEDVPLMSVPYDADVEQGAVQLYDNIPMMDAISSEVVSTASSELTTKPDDVKKDFLTIPNGDLLTVSCTPNGTVSKASDILSINVGGRKARLSAKLV